MHTTSTATSPVNLRGGQTSYLLLGGGQFGAHRLAVTWVDCPPGSRQPTHQHDDAEQIYVIVRGRGTMIVGDEERETREGDLVFIPPGTGHAIRNDSDQMLIFVSAISPPFDPAKLGPEFGYTEPTDS
jgi:quercetin dioxygenase-like cupin family protein